MPKYCSKCCKEIGPICDFCRLYNYNGNKNGVYMGKGYCVLLEKKKDPSDGCNKFICMNYKGTSRQLK